MNPNKPRKTVLIVDDTPDNISILNAALMDEYNIKVATRGKKAIEIAMTTPVDIILLDIMMPEMDGFETCRRLKQEPLTSSIPVIFITAKNEVAAEAKGLSCGGVDYIVKPISAPIVQARVKTHLALYAQNQILEDRVLKRTGELILVNKQLQGEIEGHKQAKETLQQAIDEVQRLTEQLQAENSYLKKEVTIMHSQMNMVGNTQAIRTMFKQIADRFDGFDPRGNRDRQGAARSRDP